MASGVSFIEKGSLPTAGCAVANPNYAVGPDLHGQRFFFLLAALAPRACHPLLANSLSEFHPLCSEAVSK
jgi:hypothetical protein